ncbi:ARPP-2 domain-containing protein [Streptomyces sp. NPDC088182]|uniref:ARPP-2 domain-containing protein n=1 Tax=Streptomyces sp. NPDC088182 TaxID=3365838 RepID=UPI00381D08E7
MTRLDLTGLTTRPAQVWGGIRLVPLVREEPMPGLRLHPEIYGAFGEVQVDPRSRYVSYIPHGFVADWSGDGGREAAYGTQLDTRDGDTRDGDTRNGDTRNPAAGENGGAKEDFRPETVPVHRHHRMVKRAKARKRGAGKSATATRCRFLPLHLAMEGYLSLHFGGPSIAWDEWSRQAVRQGLSPRAEDAYLGLTVRGLADALRVFEIHPGQCGVMVYTADSLAAAFVVPHPEDYRLLHPTLLQDMYGELVHQYAFFGGPVPEFEARVRDGRWLETLADLRAAARAQERAWSEAHETLLARELLTTSYSFERVYRMGAYELHRFLPPFHRPGAGQPETEQHIGELISDHKGRTAYLKTFRLSDAQIRRGHLLSRLAAHDWRLDRTAEALGTTSAELVRRMHAAGFGALLKQRT